ncbi:MAG: DUF4203 domain-containing protein [Chloroflexi bacterium]|nr:DUF4203 domain-containing protein [Chloroflexota bacterium]
MGLVSILVALVILLIGAVFCFGGFRFFRLLLPIFGFIVGFWVGEGIIAAVFDYTSTMVIVGWIVGLITGLVLAGLSYFLFTVGIVILGALFGFWLTSVVVTAVGLSNTLLVLLLSVAGAILFALLIRRANLQALLVMGITAVYGATMFITGFAMLLGVVTVEQFRSNLFVGREVISSSLLWLLLWVILLLIGFLMQYRSASDAELAQW